MINKVIKGKGFRGVLDYLFNGSNNSDPSRGNLIASNMAGTTPKQLSSEFATLRKMRPTLGKAVAHMSISLSPEDRNLTDAEFSEIATEYLNDMGFANCPFVAVRHNDTEHQHIHLVVSRIDFNGACVLDSNDFRRGEAVMRVLENKYKLTTVKSPAESIRGSPSRKEIQLTNQGAITMKNELRALIDQAIKNSNDFKDFLIQCEKLGINIIPHIQKGYISGISYEWKKSKMKGSDLGKKYAWAGIQEAIKYRPDIDFIALRKRAKIEEKKHPSIELPDFVNSAYRREYKRMILSDDYRRVLARVYGSDLLNTQTKGNNLEIELKQGTIIDSGEKITIEHMDTTNSAIMLIKLAIAKGWDCIVLNGCEEFVKKAMQEAIKQGLEITAKDEQQQIWLNEIRATLNPNVANNVKPAMLNNQAINQPPKLNPLKIGDWTNNQDKNNKNDEDGKEKQRKKFKVW